MTTPLSPSAPSAPLATALSSLLHARIEAAHLCPETGLFCLTFYAGRKLLLGVGLGPHVAGLGFLPRLPRARAPSTHPLLAALRAHLVDRRAATIDLFPDHLSISVEPPPDQPSSAPTLFLYPSRRGHARLLLPSGAILVWPPNPNSSTAPDKPLIQSPQPLETAPWASSLDALEAHGADMLARSDARALDELRFALLRAVKHKLKTLERRREAVSQDLARLDDAPRLQKIGRLLIAQAHSVPKGASRATLQDWEEGGTIDIPLSPDKPAKSQAETFFQKARRLQRGAAFMQKRLDETNREIDKVSALLDIASSVGNDPQSLDDLRARLKTANVPVGSPAPGLSSGKTKTQGSKLPERRPFHTFLGAHERAILVGRGGKDNDELITKFARPHDLWLHAKNIHGAHVIVPLDKGESCPADLLVDAATLAAHFSDARGESTCEISHVERRHVRKPRKSAPGAVTFDHEKVLVLRLEPARLERLLAAKREPSG